MKLFVKVYHVQHTQLWVRESSLFSKFTITSKIPSCATADIGYYGTLVIFALEEFNGCAKHSHYSFPIAFLPPSCFLDTASTYLKHQLLGGYLDLGTSDRIYCQDNSSCPYNIYTTGAFLIYTLQSGALSVLYCKQILRPGLMQKLCSK